MDGLNAVYELWCIQQTIQFQFQSLMKILNLIVYLSARPDIGLYPSKTRGNTFKKNVSITLFLFLGVLNQLCYLYKSNSFPSSWCNNIVIERHSVLLFKLWFYVNFL